MRTALALFAASTLAGCALVFGLGDVIDDVPDASSSGNTPDTGGSDVAAFVPMTDAGGDVVDARRDADAAVDDDDVAEVIAGFSASCVLTKSQQLYCWGSATEGILGAVAGAPLCTVNPTLATAFPCIPTPAPRADGVRAASLGAHSLCVVDGTGVRCAGENSKGQLGRDGGTSCLPLGHPGAGLCDPALLTVIPTTGAFDRVAVGTSSYHACAWSTTAGGVPVCWGSNASGEVTGTGTDAGPARPAPVVGVDSAIYKEVVVGGRGAEPKSAFTCALEGTDLKRLRCWGRPPSGVKLINGFLAHPVGGQPLHGIADVAAADDSLCVVTLKDTNHPVVTCWGATGLLQSGSAGGGTFDVASDITYDDSTRLVASYAAYCMTGRSQRPYCWGYNGGSVLAPDSGLATVCPSAPDAGRQCRANGYLDNLPVGTELALGHSHVLAKLPVEGGGSQVWAWGSNILGTLGRKPFEAGEPICGTAYGSCSDPQRVSPLP